MKKIELSDLTQRYEAIREKMKSASKDLEAATSELADFNKKTRQTLTQEIKRGKTTGNPLRDECLCIFDFDSPEIPVILDFSKRLQENAGQECIIQVGYSERLRCGGTVEEGDYVDCVGWFFGILSGKRLKLTTDAKGPWGMQFPFARYIKSKFENQRGSVRYLESLKISGYATLSPSAHDILDFLQRREKSGRCRIYIGDEIAQAHSNFKISSTWYVGKDTVYELRKELNVPTEEEKIAGINI